MDINKKKIDHENKSCNDVILVQVIISLVVDIGHVRVSYHLGREYYFDSSTCSCPI